MREWLAEQNIEQQHTTLYTREQNGVAERENRTMMEAVRGMISSSNVHQKVWVEEFLGTFTHSINAALPH